MRHIVSFFYHQLELFHSHFIERNTFLHQLMFIVQKTKVEAQKWSTSSMHAFMSKHLLSLSRNQGYGKQSWLC